MRSAFAQPVVAPLLRLRTLSIVLGVVGTIQVIAPLVRVVTFECPFAVTLGVPCPGCGLSRGCASLLRGDVHSSVAWHLFSIPFLVATILFLISIPMSARARTTLADVVEMVERRTAISTVLLTLLLLYWMFRLVYLHGHYGQLVPQPFRGLAAQGAHP